MKKLSFKPDQIKVRQGVPKVLKIALTGAFALSTLTACVETDDCTTTTTDIANPDLGQQQDPNTNCDSD